MIMLQSTDPERLNHKEGLNRGNARVYLGRRNRIDFACGLGGVGKRRDQVVEKGGENIRRNDWNWGAFWEQSGSLREKPQKRLLVMGDMEPETAIF